MMKDVKDRKIGSRYFVREENVYLVEVVAQRDDPPGRADRREHRTLLAGHVGEVAEVNLPSALLAVNRR